MQNRVASKAKKNILRALPFFAIAIACASITHAATLTNLFFLHHSTGYGLIEEGHMRAVIAAYNAAHATTFAFWDHHYNGTGLRNPAGTELGISYNIPNDNTDPNGLYYLWTSGEADATICRNTILANHQVIAFKSCFPASAITDVETLNQYKAWYLAMRNVFAGYPNRLFVVMSTPPLHRLATTATEAGNARQFANWLNNEYTAGYSNIVCFNLFDYLAGDDNMLKYAYEGDHADSDSHPNALANQTVGPIFAHFLINASLNYNPNDDPSPPVPAPRGPTIRINGATNALTVEHSEQILVTAELDAGQYKAPADWWLIAGPNYGNWYYMNSSSQWIPFAPGDLAVCQPVYQGELFPMPETTVLGPIQLPVGTYNFYFAIDQRDGMLNYHAGPIWFDSIELMVQ